MAAGSPYNSTNATSLTSNSSNTSSCYTVTSYWGNMFRPIDDPDYPWLGLWLSLPIIGIWYWCTDQVRTSHIGKDLHCPWPALFHLFLLHVHIISTLLPSSSLQCLPLHIFWSLRFTISLTGSPSSLLITCPYHLNLASFIFATMSTTSHLLISSFHYLSNHFFFISYYYMSISYQPCFLHLFCNVYLSTSSNLFISLSLTTSSSCLIITCLYHLNLASFIFSTMSTTPHLLISSFHNVSNHFFFITSYYMSTSSQPCFFHLRYNVYHSTSSDLFISWCL